MARKLEHINAFRLKYAFFLHLPVKKETENKLVSEQERDGEGEKIIM